MNLTSDIRSMKLSTALVLGLAAVAAAPVMVAPSLAHAEEDPGGHDDGHDGGGSGGAGGHDGGHGGGHDDGHGGAGHGGGHEDPAPLTLTGAGGEAATAPGAAILAAGSYVKFGLGAATGGAGNGYWLPPGYPSDPQVFFDLSSSSGAMGEIAFGRAFGNGWRGEAALTLFGTTAHAGPWSYTVPATAGPHASMSADVRSTALMANIYHDFGGGRSRIVPFLMAGVGMADNTISAWTRTNPDAGRTTRTFEGASNTGFAWSVGAGFSMEVGRALGSAPAILEVSLRHYDLGQATGGFGALPGSGAGGDPVQPLSFDVTKQVLSIGLRIPLN